MKEITTVVPVRDWMLKNYGDKVDIDTIPHMKYDPKVVDDPNAVKLTASCSHDGTLAFTQELIAKAMSNIITMSQIDGNNPPDKNKKLKGIHYVLADISVTSVYETVKLKAGNYPGQTDTVTVPMLIEYIYF